MPKRYVEQRHTCERAKELTAKFRDALIARGATDVRVVPWRPGRCTVTFEYRARWSPDDWSPINHRRMIYWKLSRHGLLPMLQELWPDLDLVALYGKPPPPRPFTRRPAACAGDPYDELGNKAHAR